MDNIDKKISRQSSQQNTTLLPQPTSHPESSTILENTSNRHTHKHNQNGWSTENKDSKTEKEKIHLLAW
jgi:hypothetical protein